MVARTDTKYESDAGTIHRILLTADYAASAGTAPTGAVNSNIKPKVSKSNREFGMRPRGVICSRTVGTAPDTFKQYTFLPVLSVASYNGTAYNPGATVSIGGTDYIVVARRPEDY